MPPRAPGAPFQHGPASPEVLVTELGNFGANDGVRVVISGGTLAVVAKFEHAECDFAIDLISILEAIQEYNARYGS